MLCLCLHELNRREMMQYDYMAWCIPASSTATAAHRTSISRVLSDAKAKVEEAILLFYIPFFWRYFRTCNDTLVTELHCAVICTSKYYREISFADDSPEVRSWARYCKSQYHVFNFGFEACTGAESPACNCNVMSRCQVGSCGMPGMLGEIRRASQKTKKRICRCYQVKYHSWPTYREYLINLSCITRLWLNRIAMQLWVSKSVMYGQINDLCRCKAWYFSFQLTAMWPFN